MRLSIYAIVEHGQDESKGANLVKILGVARGLLLPLSLFFAYSDTGYSDDSTKPETVLQAGHKKRLLPHPAALTAAIS